MVTVTLELEPDEAAALLRLMRRLLPQAIQEAVAPEPGDAADRARNKLSLALHSAIQGDGL